MKALAITAVLLTAACTRAPVRVMFDAGTYTFSAAERRAIRDITSATIAEVRHHLPTLPLDIVVRVATGSDVIPETGETGTAAPPNLIVWTVDPHRPQGVLPIVHRQLRATLFHELHHLVRDAAIPATTLLDRVVTEGLAIAFERDGAGAPVPWGQYPDNAAEWLRELQSLPANARREHWLFRHPDGRRWIGLRVGTYVADRAIERSGKSAADLVTMPAATVIALATHQ